MAAGLANATESTGAVLERGVAIPWIGLGRPELAANRAESIFSGSAMRKPTSRDVGPSVLSVMAVQRALLTELARIYR
jgi:hypothetical protein